MRKSLKIIGEVLSSVVLLLIVIPLVVAMVVNSEGFQNRIVEKISKNISEKVGVKVSIDNFYYKLFSKVEVRGLYVEDVFTPGDTMIYISSADITLDIPKIVGRELVASSVAIDGGIMKIIGDSEDITNSKVFFNTLFPPKEEKKVVEVIANSITVDNFQFEKRKHTVEAVEYGVNMSHLLLDDISGVLSGFRVKGDSIFTKVERVAFKERDDIVVNYIKCDMVELSPSHIYADRGELSFDNSYIDFSSLSLSFEQWDMSDFENKVPFDITIKNSYLELSTVERFTKFRRGWSGSLNLIGRVHGRVVDLDAEVLLATMHNSRVTSTTLNIEGLPDAENAIFTVKLGDVMTTASDIRLVYNDFTGKFMERNPILERAGAITISGYHKGTLHNFKSSGRLSTLAGAVAFDVTNRMEQGSIRLNSTLKSNNLSLGILLGNKNLGGVAFDANAYYADIDGDVDVSLSSTVGKFSALGYDYSDISIEGDIDDNVLIASVVSTDSNLIFNLDGAVDFSSKEPLYDFSLFVPHADLKAININHRDTVSLLSGEVLARGRGTSIDDINGDVLLKGLRYINHIDTINVEEVKIVNQNNEYNKSMELTSKLLDISITAKQSYKNIFPYLSATLQKYLPALSNDDIDRIAGRTRGSSDVSVDKLAQNSFYIATLDVKEANNAAGAFFPGLEIAKGSSLSFIFNPALKNFSFTLNSDKIERGGYMAEGISITSRSESDYIPFYVRAKSINMPSIYIPDFEIIGDVKENRVEAATHFNNSYDNSNAMVTIEALFEEDPITKATRVVATIPPSHLDIAERRWLIEGDSIIYGDNKLYVGNFELHNLQGSQSLEVYGTMPNEDGGELFIDINNFDISGFSLLTKSMGYYISGNITGHARLFKGASKGLVDASLAIENIKLNEFDVPDITVTTLIADGSSARYIASAQDTKFLDATYNFDTNKFFSTLIIRELQLAPVAPFVSTIASDISGVGYVNVNIDNQNMPLAINGRASITDLGATIDITNVHYKLNGDVEIKDNIFDVVGGTITDPAGVVAPLVAHLDGNDRYRKVDYRIFSSIESLLCLNTTLQDNPLFYGDIRATGNVEIVGDGNQVEMNVRASVVDNSRYYMPLSDKQTIDEADFITFKKRSQVVDESQQQQRDFITLNTKARSTDDASFSLGMNITAGTDTEVQLVIDPTLGDIIKARGVGELNIEVVPTRNIFNIIGGYEIDSGSYLFTLPNFQVLNKYFVIQPGSAISWTGDPLAANLNIIATYTTKTSLSPLLGDDASYNSRVDVNCNLMLNGELLKPDITLGIDVPDANPETSSLIASTLSSEEAVSKQIFWLLFANSFYNDGSQSSTNVTVGMMESAGQVTGLEFLSNQISNWISTDKYNLGVNYRPKSETLSDELELNFSAPLFNNRVILEAEGNYDFQNNSAAIFENSTAVTGDFNITYILSKSGNLKAKAFTRPINTFDENHGLQESGVGVYYNESFNSFKDIIDKYKEGRSIRRYYRQQKDSIKSARASQSLE